VQRRNDSGAWVRVANEGEWAVRFHWSKRGTAESVARFTGDIPGNAGSADTACSTTPTASVSTVHCARSPALPTNSTWSEALL
jgi:hypothetical protein